MAMNSLWSGGKTVTPCASKTNIQRENWNYSIICFTQCTLFFRYAKFYCRFCLPSVICGTHVTRISAGWLHILVASFGLFTWLVYIRTYCVPIATLNQNKGSRLLYLGDAQVIKLVNQNLKKTVRKVLYRWCRN